MSEKVLIVTASDAGYFDLLSGMLRSLRDKPQGRNIPIAVFDVGLTDEQAQWCRELGAMLLRAEWDFDFPGRDGVGETFKSLTARPFLPRYMPGHDIYMWLDADVWVQEWSAIELFLEGARRADIAVAPEIHRAFRHHYHAWAEFRDANVAAYAGAFSQEKADKLIRYPLINAGVFAMRADSPGWGIWEDTLREGIQRSTNMVDQIALNVAVYERGLKHEPLPSLCNWPIHHALPAWDEQRGLFVEPSLPHLPLGILHLTIYTKTRLSFEIPQLGGGKRWMSVRYVPPGEDRARPASEGFHA